MASFSEFAKVFLNGTKWQNWRSSLEPQRAHWKLSLFRTFCFSSFLFVSLFVLVFLVFLVSNSLSCSSLMKPRRWSLWAIAFGERVMFLPEKVYISWMYEFRWSAISSKDFSCLNSFMTRLVCCLSQFAKVLFP